MKRGKGGDLNRKKMKQRVLDKKDQREKLCIVLLSLLRFLYMTPFIYPYFSLNTPLP
jgi:hypothetical protein